MGVAGQKGRRRTMPQRNSFREMYNHQDIHIFVNQTFINFMDK